MKSVAVFGAGIAGLAAAHELQKAGYLVTVYEALGAAGGLARSEQTGGSPPGEVSWRGYGPFYHNAFALMREIPVEGPQKTVYGRLTRPVDFIFTDGGSLREGLTWGDQLRLGWEVLRSMGACPERVAHYASLNAADHLRGKLSPRGHQRFTEMFGPWVGIDPQRASLHHVMCFIKKLAYPGAPAPHILEDPAGSWTMGASSSWAVFDAPTSEAWFDPWVKHLESRGVRFVYGAPLESLTVGGSPRQVTGAQCGGNAVDADHYVCAVGPFQMAQILSNSPNLEREAALFRGLTQDGEHLQVSFRLGFRALPGGAIPQWPGERRALIISESPFNLTLYRQDDLWPAFADKCMGGIALPEEGCLAALWSGTACVSYAPGILYGKPVASLTKPEFEAEVLAQLEASPGFDALVREGTGLSFAAVRAQALVYLEVWHTFVFEPRLHNPWEPKFVDSYTTRPFQPESRTRYENLWFAGGHVRTGVELYSMEGAAETGRRVASEIAGGPSRVIPQQEVTGAQTLQTLDGLCFRAGLPHAVDVLAIVGGTILLVVLVLGLRWLVRRFRFVK